MPYRGGGVYAPVCPSMGAVPRTLSWAGFVYTPVCPRPGYRAASTNYLGRVPGARPLEPDYRAPGPAGLLPWALLTGKRESRPARPSGKRDACPARQGEGSHARTPGPAPDLKKGPHSHTHGWRPGPQSLLAEAGDLTPTSTGGDRTRAPKGRRVPHASTLKPGTGLQLYLNEGWYPTSAHPSGAETPPPLGKGWGPRTSLSERRTGRQPLLAKGRDPKHSIPSRKWDSLAPLASK